MRGSLVSWETIVLINPRLNNFGNLQSCCNTSWWISVERTCLHWTSLSPGRHQSQPQDRLGWRQASLSAGYMISKSSLSKVRAAEWGGASGRCVAGKFEKRNGSVATVDGLACATNTSPHMLSGDTFIYIYVDNDAGKSSQIVCMDLELAILRL